MARLAGVMVPVPTGLAADLIGSLDHPMTASGTLLRDYVPDPDCGLTGIEDAVAASLSGRSPLRVDVLEEVHAEFAGQLLELFDGEQRRVILRMPLRRQAVTLDAVGDEDRQAAQAGCVLMRLVRPAR